METFPFANHEVIMCKDAILALISIVAGEELPDVNVGFQNEKPYNAVNETVIGGQRVTGGREVAPGVVMYDPIPQPENPAVGADGGALIDVAAGLRAMPNMPPPMHVPGNNPELIDVQGAMPKPLPGSLMDTAQRGESLQPPSPAEHRSQEVTTRAGVPPEMAGPPRPHHEGQEVSVMLDPGKADPRHVAQDVEFGTPLGPMETPKEIGIHQSSVIKMAEPIKTAEVKE